MKKLIKNVFKILISFILLMIITTYFTPTPIVYLSNKLIFVEKPIGNLPKDFESFQVDVESTKDQSYTSSYLRNTYDLYTPKTPNNNLIVWVHGGGFVGGDKSMIEGYGTVLASHGYTVLAPNYTLSPKTHYPDPIYQLDELFAYVDENFEYDKLYLAGDSAGGHLISQYALIQTDKAYAQNFKTSSDIEIHGLLLYSPLLEIEALTSGDSKIINSLFNQVARSYINDKSWKTSTKTQEANIINHLTQNFPPTYITDGNTGSFEPSNKRFVEKLKAQNIKHKSRFFKEETIHEFQFSMDTKPSQITVSDTLEFLSELDALSD